MSLIIRAETTEFVTALKTISFVEAGITEANCQVIYKGGSLHYLSYIPGDDFNGITGFEEGEGYQINALQDIDLSGIATTTGELPPPTSHTGRQFCFQFPGIEGHLDAPRNYLQWRYEGDTTWIDFAPLPEGGSGTAIAASYTKTLGSGFSVAIPQSEHGLIKVKGVTTLNASGQEITLAVGIVANDVTINSNINFQNFKAIIF